MSKLRHTLAFVVLAVGFLHGAEHPLHAQERSGNTMAQAATAWGKGLINDAAELYEKALKEGKLLPPDVITAYARIGTVRTALGKREIALRAFRVVALLSPSFELSAESGVKAKGLYSQARKEVAARGGKLSFTAEVPTKVSVGESFSVRAKIPSEFVSLVDQLSIEVKDNLTQSVSFADTQPAAATVSFEVPAVMQSGTTLLVRLNLLDSYANHWALQEARVKVTPSQFSETSSAPRAPGNSASATPFSSEATHTALRLGAQGPAPEGQVDQNSKSGFWSTPWPYVLGCAVVAGGIAAFVATRPPNQVTMSAPMWR